MARAAEPAEAALALCRQGRFADAAALLESALARRPRERRAAELLGAILVRLGDAAAERGDTEAALARYDRCLALYPASAQVLYNKGVALQRARRSAEAEACHRAAIAAEPAFAPAYGALGVLRAEAGDALGAEALHRQAIAAMPANAELHNNLGIALDQQQRHDEAIASYDAALALAPANGAAWLNRGVALHQLGRLDDAVASIERALALDAGDAEAWSNLGLVLRDLHRFDEALAAYERATTLRPAYVDAWANRGAALLAEKHYGDALECFERALAIEPAHGEVLGSWLHTKMLLCDWAGLDAAVQRVAAAVEAGAVVHPFALLPTPRPAALHRRCAERYVQARSPSVAPLATAVRVHAKHERIRLGYFSADFHHHATMVLMADMFERHDRQRFELTAFSFGPPSSDAMRQRVLAAFDRFVDVRGQGDADVAALARTFEIDIAIDLKGHTEGARPGIFARRAAPLQVGYIGYPGTSGAPFIDYLIADPVVLPQAAFADFTECIVHLPHCFLTTAPWQAIVAAASGARAAARLPEDALVFCCFNNGYKITPDAFAVWMRLLAAVPGSVLWLLESTPGIGERLRREAAAHGIAGERLVFARRCSTAEHLQRHACADVFVDTLHYGAHTTAIDALRCGLPLVTLCGPTFAGRVASSALHALGMAELVTTSLADYEALALALARDGARRARLRKRMAEQAPAAPLFDVERFTRGFEAACRTMIDRAAAGLPPAHFAVAQ